MHHIQPRETWSGLSPLYWGLYFVALSGIQHHIAMGDRDGCEQQWSILFEQIKQTAILHFMYYTVTPLTLWILQKQMKRAETTGIIPVLIAKTHSKW